MIKKHILWQKENATVFTVCIRQVRKLMKLIPMLCICFALFIGCGSDSDDTDSIADSIADNLPNLDDPKVREQILAEALDEDNLQTRQSPSGEELYYAPNQETPYTGWVKATEDDIPYALWQMQNGKMHGIYLKWYDNQQNQEKVFYKDGVENGLWTFWAENGEKYNGLVHDSTSDITFSPDGSTFASGSYDRTIRLWDVETWMHKHTLKGHAGGVSSVAFSPDGKQLASGSLAGDRLAGATFDGTIRLWDVATGTQKHILEGHRLGFYSVAFSPDGKTLASDGDDGTIRLWDVATGHIQTLIGHTRGVSSVAFSPDGKTLASGSLAGSSLAGAIFHGTICLWDVATNTQKHILEVWGSVSSIAFSPDGKTLASGDFGRTIRLWDVATGTQKHTLEGHTRTASSVTFSPDGKTLASGGDDGTIRLWDVATSTQKHTLTHLFQVSSVAFSPDGKTLASNDHRTIRLWDVP